MRSRGHSRRSSTPLDGTAGAIASLSTGTVSKPVAQPPLDFLIVRVRMTAPKILPHQIDPGIEQIKRRA